MRRSIAISLPILMLVLAQLACGQATSNTVETQARRDQVTVTRSGGRPQPLLAPGQQSLGVGDGVDVDELGQALLRFGDSLTVELLRDGALVLQELADSDQSFLVTLLQGFGTTFNDFDAPAEIKRRLTIETGQAVIVATGTQFLVVREGKTPLDWVIALQAGQDDLMVTAGGVSKPIPAGMARWVGPEGEPSEAIPFDRPAVESWLESLRQGVQQPEVGEIVWEQADLLANTEPVRSIGDGFALQGVPITPDPQGLFGSPEYWLEDCNADGIDDVAMRGGRLWMDLRAVPARVRALDVTVLNRSEPGDGALRGLDPARKPLSTDKLAVGPGQLDVLSLRSEAGQPIHYGELGLVDGCFLGFSLTPQQRSGNPGQPRPAVELPLPIRMTFTVEPQQLLASQCATLRWQVENAETVYLNGQPVAAEDSVERCLKATTTFTLQAEGPAGDQQQAVTVGVSQPPEPLAEFWAEPATVTAADCAVVLTWETRNAEAVFLDGEPVRSSGSAKFCPQETTTYTLRVVGLAGLENSYPLTVTVEPAVTLADFLGTWINTADESQFWTRLVIGQGEGDSLRIEPYYACDASARGCPFGVLEGRLEGELVTALYELRGLQIAISLWREGEMLQARTLRQSTLRTAPPVEVTESFQRPRLILPTDRLILPERLLPVRPLVPLLSPPIP